MSIAEPTTTLTDYALTLLGAVLGLRLGVRAGPLPARLWGAAFVATGLAAGVGGTLHGFGLSLAMPTRAVLWNVVYVAIALGSFFLLAGGLLALIPPRFRPHVMVLLGLHFVVSLAWTLERDFRFVMYDFALTLVVLLGAALYGLVRGEASAPGTLGGVLVSLLGAFVQTQGFDLHPRFNHNDLFHVLEMTALVLYYRAGLRFSPR